MVLVLLISIGLIAHSKSCTEFILKAKDNSVVVGRTLDFPIVQLPGVYTEPKGTIHHAILPKSCTGKTPLLWRNLCKVIHIRIVATSFNYVSGEGINDGGLSAAALYLPGYTQYEDIPLDGCGNAISQLQLVTFILAQYTDVQQVRDALNSGKFPSVWGQKAFGEINPLHYAITDRSGGAIVLEYTPSGRKFHNNFIRVLTNSPTYDWHETNWKHQVGLSNKRKPERTYNDSQGRQHVVPQLLSSGLLGLPGDYTSASRFIRAASLVHLSTVPKTAEKAVVAAFHILNSVDVTHGVTEGFGGVPSYTQWSVVKDLANNCIYYRSYECVSIQKICLKDVGETAQWFALDDNFKDCVTDMAGRLKLMKTEL